MAIKKARTVISLGGSVIIPSVLSTDFLKKFHDLIVGYLDERQFFMVTGGGYTARHYQTEAGKIVKLTHEDLDWLGIHASRLNAHLIRTIFRAAAHPKVLHHPDIYEKVDESIIVAGGEKPGNSTDHVAVKFAKTYGVQEVVNLSNVDTLFDKDPKKYKTAKPIYNISWKEFRKLVGDTWKPGLSTPFDPIASKLAEELKLRVVLLNGTNLKNLKAYLDGKAFVGTVIE